MSKHFLAIDCGTQSVRVLVFDVSGVLVARVKRPLDIYQRPSADTWQFSPERLWAVICQALHQLWELPAADPLKVVSISVTAQRGTLVFLDHDGNSTHPAISWMDTREASQPPTLSALRQLLFLAGGAKGKVGRLLRRGQANWLKQNKPDEFHRTARFLMVSGFLNYRLTGEYKDSSAAQVGYLPFNYKQKQWLKGSDWRWHACSMRPDQMTDLVDPNHQIGSVSAEAARATGLIEGTPVIASGADKACEMLGCGMLKKTQLHISYGTTATTNRVSQYYTEPARFLPSYPGADGQVFCSEFQLYRGYWLVSWFREQFAHAEKAASNDDGRSPEQHLDDLASNIEPGCNGLVLLPFWSKGLSFPNNATRGAFIGLNDTHTRGHLYRAVLEGIAMGLKLGQLKTKGGLNGISEIWLSGGGAQSHTARQITANVFNLPVSIPHTTEASGLGAAINGAVGVGAYPDTATALKKMLHTESVIEPEPNEVIRYQRIFKKIFKPACKSLNSVNICIENLFGANKADQQKD